jgi:hypothetical protein
MYVAIQKLSRLVLDAQQLYAHAPTAAAATALLAYQARCLRSALHNMLQELPIGEAPPELAQAIRDGEVVGPDARKWLPLCIAWLKAECQRYRDN